jgi:DNA-binding response OmpR family regulator
MSLPSVLIVEDEPDLRGTMCAFLAASGFDVRGVDDGWQLDRALAERPANILVLDVNLPGEDGFSIASRMRRYRKVGIIMLTARGQSEDRITGLEVGADNYLTKPVVLRELVAAITGLWRRLEPGPPPPTLPLPAWSFDPDNWQLVAANGTAVTLTTAEFCMVSLLTATAGTAVSAKDLLQALGKDPGKNNRRSLDSVLNRLRRKVEKETGEELPIKAIRHVGYIFASRVRNV